MKITRDSLTKKGWSEEEIEKTLKIMGEAKENKHKHIKKLDEVVYWIVLLFVMIGNFAFSTYLIPLLLLINSISLYLIIFLLAFAFGVIMSTIIKDIEDLETKHHFAFLSIIPVVGLINFIVIVRIANNHVIARILENYNNPFIVGIVYLVGFLVPYAYLVHEEKWKRGK